VEDSGLGLISGYSFSVPYEDMRLKGRWHVALDNFRAVLHAPCNLGSDLEGFPWMSPDVIFSDCP
jgi:hypothetical protein